MFTTGCNPKARRAATVDGERVVVLAAHPDDETLGAGGAMLVHRAHGDRVHVVVATEGVTARHPETGRQEECLRRAMARLGVDSVRTLALPDQRLDSLPCWRSSRRSTTCWRACVPPSSTSTRRLT
ncbi:PIG-L family deacetylase [bacterium]|nr:PIG-L family deacetylase [bacterium]